MFEYQHVDDSGFSSAFTVEVQNSHCESQTIPRYLARTDRGEWNSDFVHLKTGLNTIYWRLYSLSADVKQHIKRTVSIRVIQITGVAFTSECTKCEAGMYSGIGASDCIPCPINTYSSIGSSQCTPCDEDTEYSDNGASECVKRPRCTVEHYVSYQSACTNGQTQKLYDWIKPKLCVEGVELPEPGQLEPCPPCNPGMHLVNGTCHFCPANQYSNGSSTCIDCPGSTSPETGVVYKQWSHLPHDANISSLCVSLNGGSQGCRSQEGWYPATNYIETVHVNSDDVFHVLSLDIGGFRGDTVNEETSGNTDDVTVAEVSFMFETHCTSGCIFHFLKQTHHDVTQLVHSWSGSMPITAFRLKITSTTRVKLSWAFQKLGDTETSGDTFTLINDYARISLINVTNTLRGGAERCRHCPRGASLYGCVPCPEGHYIDPTSNLCTPCPPNTVVSAANSWGIESCLPCGEGLVPYRGRRCVSLCYLNDSQGHIRNFTALSGLQLIPGPRLFTVTGHAYFHAFNISLCGGVENHPLATCTSNMTSSFHPEGTDDVSGHVCQSTILLSDNPAQQIVSVSPVSLGETLIRITDHADGNITSLLKETGFMPSDTTDWNNSTNDIYMLYTSDTPTVVCHRGRTVLVILRCDDVQPSLVELPPHCTDATCDGCNFVFLLKTISACPVCTHQHFLTYSSTCVDGSQQIVTQMNRTCNPSSVSGLPVVGQKTQQCSLLWQQQWPTWLKVIVILVPVILLSGIILVSTVIYCWLRNKSLEYKYMKLVASSSVAGAGYSEMPTAETCALGEGEEDDEQFDVTKIRQPNKLFTRFKLSSTAEHQSMEDNETFESFRMSEKALLT
jgi:hypothetical protein